jgi:hypothetical protein
LQGPIIVNLQDYINQLWEIEIKKQLKSIKKGLYIRAFMLYLLIYIPIIPKLYMPRGKFPFASKKDKKREERQAEEI